jgi:hypothetical protein
MEDTSKKVGLRALAKVCEGFGVLSLGAAIFGGVAVAPALVLGGAGVLLLIAGIAGDEVVIKTYSPSGGQAQVAGNYANYQDGAGATKLPTVPGVVARVNTQDNVRYSLPSTRTVTPAGLRVDGLPKQVVDMLIAVGMAPDGVKPLYLYQASQQPDGLIWLPEGATPAQSGGETYWQMNLPTPDGIPAAGWNALTGVVDKRGKWPLS